jgi:lysophospholipase L1-like esterase
VLQAATDPYKALFYNRLGLSPAAIGLLVGFDLVVRASGLLLSGWAQRRFGAKRMLVLGDAVSWVLPYLVLSVASRPWQVVVAVLLTSLNSFASTPYNCLMAEGMPAERRTRAYTLLHLWNIAPSLLIPWCAGVLLAHHSFLPTLRVLFLVQAFTMAIGIGWRALRLEDLSGPGPEDGVGMRSVLGRLLSNPAFLAAWFAVATQGLFSQIWGNFSAIFLVRHLHLSDQIPAWAAEAGAVGFGLGSILLQPRLGERSALRAAPWGLGIQAAGTLVLLFHPSAWTVAILALAGGICSSLYTAATSSIITSVLPESIRDHGFALSFVGVQLTGALLMPWAGRMLQLDMGWFPWIAAGALATWAIGVAIAQRRLGRPPDGKAGVFPPVTQRPAPDAPATLSCGMHEAPKSISLLAMVALVLLCSRGPAGAADLKIACVGNSITYGYGLDNPATQSYPTDLDTLLGSGYAVSNFGVSSKTMIKAVSDAYWTQSAFTQAMASQPDMVVIELGTNDCKDYIWPYYKQDFQPDYVSMIDTFRNLPSHPQVWAILPPPAQNSGWSMYDTTIVRQVNPAILAVALRKAAPVIDLHTAMSGHPEWFQSDTVHPTAAGAKQLAKFVAAYLLHAPVTITNAGGTLSATKGYGYQWYRNDSALSGATGQTCSAKVAGPYKVSVQIDSANQSRLVSAALAATPTGLSAPSPGRPAVRVFVASTGRITLDAPPSSGPVTLRVWNARGMPVSADHPVSGIYLCRISGPGFAERSSLVAVP